MRIFGRMVCALGVFVVFAGGVLTANATEPTPVAADWGQPCNLPSVTSAPAANEAPIQLVSCEEAACENPGCAVSGDCVDYCPCCHNACWDVTAGAVFLNRSRPNSAVIATPQTGTLGTLLNGNAYTFGWDAGPEIVLTRETDSGLLIQGRFLDDRDAEATSRINGVTTFRIAGIGVTILGGGSINSQYTTNMDTAELNVGVPLCQQWTFLAGFRWLELQDQLHLQIATPAIITNWDESNQLYGGQMGVNVNFTNPANRLQFSGALKAGVYGNTADNRFSSRIVSGAFDSDTDTAFVGEMDFYGTFWITRHISVRSGYMVMWIQDVALASDQAPTTHQAAGGTQSPINTNGDLWYNGANVALEFKW